MSHEIVKRYKVLTARSAEDITNEINYFCSNKKIESVTVNTASTNLEGTNLRSSNYCLTFIATIAYEFDITEEKIQNELIKFIEKRNFYTPKAVKEFCESEEFKKFEKEIVEKYEKEA
jgi:hypothetical protein